MHPLVLYSHPGAVPARLAQSCPAAGGEVGVFGVSPPVLLLKDYWERSITGCRGRQFYCLRLISFIVRLMRLVQFGAEPPPVLLFKT